MRNEKSLPKYLIHEDSKCQHFYFWINSSKSGQILQLFTLYSKDRHFSITKLDIFCNILHLEMDFWSLSLKRIVSSSTFWQKSFHNLNILSANWHFLKLCNSFKINVWHLRSLEKLAIKMCFPFNFAKKLKDRHFVMDRSENLKLETFFFVSVFEKIYCRVFCYFRLSVIKMT